MLNTNLPQFESDLKEVINLFSKVGEFNIRHHFSNTDNKIVNTITVNGKVYAYGNLVKNFDNEIVRKRLTKRYAKLSLYKALVAFTGVVQPWGALTGIRPTKLAYDTLEKDGEFKDFFLSTMKVSEQKTKLVEQIIETQKGIYTKDIDSSDLFVFIPFCPTRCRYCSFISADVKSARKHVKEYVDTLIYEIRESVKHVKKLRSIYIGGGTPISLELNDLERILIEIDKINTGVEFTVEAGRPDKITPSVLDLLEKYKVTRICVNPQTLNDKTLELIGRNHTAQQVYDSYALAKGRFIINMDLIAGLYGENFNDFKNTLDKVVELSPDNITVHTLCVKKGSYLSNEQEEVDATFVEQMVDYAYKTLTEKGYSPYYMYRQKYMAGNLENVGYCKKGTACVYNVNAMEEISNVVACGANAISKRVNFEENRIERQASPKDVITYLGKIERILEEKSKLFY